MKMHVDILLKGYSKMAKRKVFSIGSSLSDGLEQTIAAAHNYSSDLRIDVIPLNKICTDPENPRTLTLTLSDAINGLSSEDPQYDKKVIDMESLYSLSNSIKEQGIINPVVVYECNGMYKLIAGERRTLASAIANKTDIQAKIIDGKPNQVRIRILQWIENIERSDLSLAEKMDNLEKIIDAYAQQNNIERKDVTITQISQLIGCVKSHAINLKAVLEADSDLKMLIASNQIRSLEKAAIISNIKTQSLRATALNECVRGATLKQLKEMLNQDKEKPRGLPIQPVNKAGRPSLSVNFGKTPNVKVAGMILRSVISNPEFESFDLNISEINFDNPKIISDVFKQIIQKLEQIHD